MNKTLKKIKDYEIYINSTRTKAVIFTIIEVHLINVLVNYIIYNTFDIFNIKTIIPSVFYGILLGIVSFYVIKNILRKKSIEIDLMHNKN